jgi:cyanamide hydratase
MPNSITTHGFTAVPASATILLTSTSAYPAPTSRPSPIPVTSTEIPNTPLAQRINSYVKARLPEPTYNHSLRVYHYGLAIKQYRFAAHADWQFSDETYFLACLLHDIGTTEENLTATHLSFEFYGGLLAMDVLQKNTNHNQGGALASVSSRDQAESVVEAIIRHQDLCEIGKITALGQLLQLATIFGTYLSAVITDHYDYSLGVCIEKGEEGIMTKGGKLNPKPILADADH